MPLRLNLAAYNEWIRDAQHATSVVVGGAPAAITVNVPSARVSGFEADGQVRPVSWMNVGASLNYIDARFIDNMVSIAGGQPVAFGPYPDTPRWSGTAFGELSAPLKPGVTGSLRADVYSQANVWFDARANSNPGTNLPAYTLVNFRAAVSLDHTGLTLSANVRNAFDRVYYVGGEALGLLFQDNMAVPGDRRTFTVEARYQF
jgi:iron complex outermembrane receptor protein